MDDEILETVGRLRIAERFGYRLDYIDSLEPYELANIYGFMDGDGKARKHHAMKRGK